MVSPMIFRPSERSIAATVEESTPPDMATAMVEFRIDESVVSHRQQHPWEPPSANAGACRLPQRRQLPQMSQRFGHERKREIHILSGVLLSQAEADAGARSLRTQAHSSQYMRGLDGA